MTRLNSPSHQRAGHGGADVGGGADDVAHAGREAVDELLRGLRPVDAEVQQLAGFEVEALEHMLRPADELLHIGRQALRHDHHRVDQPREQNGEEDDHHAQRDHQRADDGERRRSRRTGARRSSDMP